jgi:RNA polymerase sigma factor (sigma-70 family)
LAAAADFEDWVLPHVPAMRRLAAVMSSANDCDDVVQEALARAWARRADFDPARGSPRAWLLMLTADRGKLLRRRLSRPLRAPSAPPALELGPESADLDLRAAVSALPARQRQAVMLFYYASLTAEETAAAMGVSLGTVKSTLHDARKRLARTLEVSDARVT